jgi:hypothetical protein
VKPPVVFFVGCPYCGVQVEAVSTPMPDHTMGWRVIEHADFYPERVCEGSQRRVVDGYVETGART